MVTWRQGLNIYLLKYRYFSQILVPPGMDVFLANHVVLNQQCVCVFLEAIWENPPLFGEIFLYSGFQGVQTGMYRHLASCSFISRVKLKSWFHPVPCMRGPQAARTGTFWSPARVTQSSLFSVKSKKQLAGDFWMLLHGQRERKLAPLCFGRRFNTTAVRELKRRAETKHGPAVRSSSSWALAWPGCVCREAALWLWPEVSFLQWLVTSLVSVF